MNYTRWSNCLGEQYTTLHGGRREWGFAVPSGTLWPSLPLLFALHPRVAVGSQTLYLVPQPMTDLETALSNVQQIRL